TAHGTTTDVVTSRSVPVTRSVPLSASSRAQDRSGRGLRFETDPRARPTANARSPCWMVSSIPSLHGFPEAQLRPGLPLPGVRVRGYRAYSPDDRQWVGISQALLGLSDSF